MIIFSKHEYIIDSPEVISYEYDITVYTDEKCTYTIRTLDNPSDFRGFIKTHEGDFIAASSILRYRETGKTEIGRSRVSYKTVQHYFFGMPIYKTEYKKTKSTYRGRDTSTDWEFYGH